MKILLRIFFYCNIQHKKWQSGGLVEWKICIIWSKTFVKIAWNCSFFWLSLMSCILEWIWMVFIFLHIVQKCPWFESENESNLKTLLLRLIFEIRNLYYVNLKIFILIHVEILNQLHNSSTLDKIHSFICLETRRRNVFYYLDEMKLN